MPLEALASMVVMAERNEEGMKFDYKSKPCDEKSLQIIHVGTHDGMTVFLYADVLEELIFYAKDKDAFGLLMGNAYLDNAFLSEKKADNSDSVPPEKETDCEVDIPDFVEITAFKDVYPVSDALDYADHLRKMRNFRDTESESLCLGAVCLTSKAVDITLECLYLLRTYFDVPSQVLLFVSADGTKPRAYQLGKNMALIEIGLEIVCIRGEPLPFAE